MIPSLSLKDQGSTPPNSDSEEPDESLDFFDFDLVYIRKNNVRPIKKASVQVQVRKTNRLVALGVDVRDVPLTLAHIAESKWAPNTRNGYLQSLASVMSVFPELQTQYKAYSAASVKGRKVIDKAAESSRLSAKESKYPKWDDISQLYLMGQTIYDRALMGLYTLLPPRRVSDVASLVYAPASPSSPEEEKDQNFISEDYEIITYSVYKTAKTYGTVGVAVPEKLQELLQELDLKPGDRVFSDVKNFSRHISKTFASVADSHITVNALRHSFISHFLSKPRSTAQRKAAARLMGHSTLMQQAYMRLELTNDFDPTAVSAD